MGNTFSGVDDMGVVHDQYFSSFGKSLTSLISCGIYGTMSYEYDEPFHNQCVNPIYCKLIQQFFLLIPPWLVRRFICHVVSSHANQTH